MARGPTAAAAALALTVAAASLALSPGCNQAEPAPPPYGTVDVRLGSKIFHLEVAASEQARANGLMHRDSLPQDRGMVFVFSTEEPRSFWMKNVWFPLDIVFLDSAGRVVGIKQMQANERDDKGRFKSTHSDVPLKFAIELNKGAAAAAGLKVGDTVELPPEARRSRD